MDETTITKAQSTNFAVLKFVLSEDWRSAAELLNGCTKDELIRIVVSSAQNAADNLVTQMQGDRAAAQVIADKWAVMAGLVRQES